MNNTYERAIPFIIKNNQTQEYQLTPLAQSLLKSIQKPLSIVSVAGQYRTGKSYLLNSVILDKKNIFGVGSTTNACTKGLWVWVQPDPIDKSRMMLVIDTEGLAALDEESNHDMKIFSLAVLLSTTFVYNSFGNIDETALQTLSLVLNLISSIDKDASSCRPQFIWVVRDFSLQLIDEEGKILSPKQYLEMALSTNSKQNDKIVIRNTISNAFSERDCFTLVKPVIDELKLQNLDSIPIDELRPQFVSQSIALRNKIKTTLKSFRLNGKSELKGYDYIMVIKNYLNAINKGAIPNIVDTWTYIKEEKRRSALEEIKKIYSEKVQLKIVDKIPMKHVNLEKLFNTMKVQIKSQYLKMTYDQFLTEEIDNYLEKTFKQLSQLNYEQNHRTIKKIVEKEFEPFKRKLYSDYYSNFEEYESDLRRNFRELCAQKYDEKFENFKDYLDRYADNKSNDSFKHFEKKLKAQIKKQTQIKEQASKTLEFEMESLKSAWQIDKQSNNNKINDLERQIRMLLQEKGQVAEMSKTQISLFEDKINNLKRKNQQLNLTIDQLNKEGTQSNSTLVEIRQKLFMETKQHQKEKALFVQKQEHWNRKIQDLQRKNKDLQQNNKQNGTRFQTDRKKLITSFESHIQNLEKTNKQYFQKIGQLQLDIYSLKDQKNRLEQKYEQIKKSNLSQKKILQERIISAESNKKPSKRQNEFKQQNQWLQEELQKLKTNLISKDTMLRLLEQEKKNIENNYQQEIAIHLQQIQFKQIQIKSINQRYDQLKRTHQQTLESMNDTSKSFEENNQMKIFQLTTEHQNQIQNIENLYEEKMKTIRQEVQMLEKHKQELILQIALEKKQFQAKQREWKQSNIMLQTMCEKLEKKIKSSEKDYEDISKEKQNFYSLRVKQLEEEIQVNKEKALQEVDEIQKKSQEAYAILKHYSQLEKEQWQRKITDEKSKSSKRLNTQKQEYERKLNEEKQNYQEEINQLQEKLAHLERTSNERYKSLQYDYDIKFQKLNNQYMEVKVQLNKQIALISQKLQITKHNHERQLANKIKEHEESIEELRKSLSIEYQNSLKRIVEEKQLMETKYDTMKKTNKHLEQSNLTLKNQVEKIQAVFKEKQLNYERNIGQLETRLQNQLLKFNKMIQTINANYESEIQKLNCEIERLNINVLELEEEKNKLQGDFQMQRKSLKAKMEFLQTQKQKYKADYEDIMSKFEVSVNKLSKDKQLLIQKKKEEFQTLKNQYEQKMGEVSETHRKMLKQTEDRVSRFNTENKSLKDRLTILELEKSGYSNKKKNDDVERIYEKKIDQYENVIRKLKEELYKAKNEKIEYSERESFINDLSSGNSAIFQGQNRPLISRKSNNTPLISKKSRKVEVSEFGGFMKHNDKYKY